MLPAVRPHFDCPVCGHPSLTSAPYEIWPPPTDLPLEPPYELQLGAPSYEVCHRCAFEFGFDDNPGAGRGQSFDEYRAGWEARGRPWLSDRYRREEAGGSTE